MTKKEVLRFSRLFNDLVQKKVNGHPDYKLEVHHIDHLGGNEVILKPGCIVWPNEVQAIDTICHDMSLSCVLRFHDGIIVIH